MPEIKYGVNPFAPKQQDNIEEILLLNGASEWRGALLYSHGEIGSGWQGGKEMLEHEALVIFNDREEAQPVTDIELFKASLFSGDADEGKTANDLLPYMKASMEGRLCIVQKDTGRLIQVQTEVTKDGAVQVSFAKPVKAFENLDPDVPEEPDALLEKPVKPGLWTRIVAFFFKNSASAQAVRDYERALAAYNEQQAKLDPRPVSEKSGSVEPRKAAAGKAADKDAVAETYERVEDVVIENTIRQLEEEADQSLTHDISSLKIGASTSSLLRGFSSAKMRYGDGKSEHAELLKDLKAGIRPGGTELEEKLGDALLAGMIERAVKGDGKTPEDAANFYLSVDKNQGQLEQWKKELLETPSAKALINGGVEALRRALGSSTNFNRLLNNVLVEVQTAKARSSNADGPQNRLGDNQLQGEIVRQSENGRAKIPGGN